MPLSMTRSCMPAPPPANVQGSTDSSTRPGSSARVPVNFTALPNKLSSTWRSRVGSDKTHAGNSGETNNESSINFELADTAMICATPSTNSRKCTGKYSTVS